MWTRRRMPRKDPSKPNCETCGGRQLVSSRNAAYQKCWKLCVICEGSGNEPDWSHLAQGELSMIQKEDQVDG